MKIKPHFLLIIFLLTISCKKDSTIIYDKEIVNRLADYDFESEIPAPPSPSIYVKIKNGEIFVTNPYQLYITYKAKYKTDYKNFESFLFEVMNQKKIIDKSDLYYHSEYFKPNHKIITEYNNGGFKGLTDKYCSHLDNSYLFKNKPHLSYEEIQTIGYYAYLNKFTLAQDCVSGNHTIFKFEYPY